jgi:hypothetical protein
MELRDETMRDLKKRSGNSLRAWRTLHHVTHHHFTLFQVTQYRVTHFQ